LDQKDYKTIRTNKIIKPHNLDSTYRKGKVRENRINRDFESKISDVKMSYWFCVSLLYETNINLTNQCNSI